MNNIQAKRAAPTLERVSVPTAAVDEARRLYANASNRVDLRALAARLADAPPAVETFGKLAKK